MGKEKVQALAELLDDAIQHVVIKHESRDEQVPLPRYQLHLQRHWYSYVPELEYSYLNQFMPVITDLTLEKRLFETIRADLEDYIVDDKIQLASIKIVGGPIGGFDLHYLIRQIIRVALVKGSMQSSLSFYRSVAQTPATYQAIALLNGIHVEQEIEISQGIRLVPLPDSTSRLPNYLPYMRFMSAIDLLNRTVLILDYNIHPIFANPEIAALQFDDHFSRVPVSSEYPDFDIDKFCDALSMSCNGSIEYMAIWGYLAPDEIFHVKELSSGGVHHYKPFSLHNYDRTSVTKLEVRNALDILDKRKELDASVTKQLDVSINRWIKSKTDQSLIDSIIDLTIALEAIYLGDTDRQTELSYRLRLRTAWYLGKNIDERSNILNTVNKVYELRSKALHGAKESPDTTTKDFKTSGQDLCLRSILKIIENGRFPNWNLLVLGDVSQFESA